jgi:hypothetical protein
VNAPRNRHSQFKERELGAKKFVAPKNQKLTIRDLLEAKKQVLQLNGKLSNQTLSAIARAVVSLVRVERLTCRRNT